MRSIRAETNTGMAALPFERSRLVILRRHKPERGAIVMAGRDAFALGVQGNAGDRCWMRE